MRPRLVTRRARFSGLALIARPFGKSFVVAMLTTPTRAAVNSAREVPSRLDRLRHAIDHAAHFLPAQGPITAFVHHNTLHAFEHLPFEEGVVAGAKTFGCHPFLTEESYVQKLNEGRIRHDDLEAVLIDDLGDRGDELLGMLGTRFHLRMSMLSHPLPTGPTAELKWVVAETEVLRRFRSDVPPAARRRMIDSTRRWVMLDLRNCVVSSPENTRAKQLTERIFDHFDKPNIETWGDETWEEFCLHLLWLVCRDGIHHAAPHEHDERHPVRHAEWLREATGEDCDQRVHELLIPFCAAFLDQGFGSWTLPDRGSFFRSFSCLYGGKARARAGWMAGLSDELNRLAEFGKSSLESIDESLEILGVDEEQIESYLTDTLLSLSGYGGMLWQVEQRGDRVAHPAPPNTLIEFVAVRLILDRLAATSVAREALGYTGELRELRSYIAQQNPKNWSPIASQRTFLVFQLAQLLGWAPDALYRLFSSQWSSLVSEIEAFSRLERRRIYHLAFERRYRVQALDAVLNHNRRAKACDKRSNGDEKPRPLMQVICCLDDREESFRRHLEEVAPEAETFSTAGFFAVAMYYRGAADAHFTPLCPVIIKPQHYLVENVVEDLQTADEKRRKRRRAIGTVTRQVHIGSRTFAGGWLAGVFGSLASIPLVMRILFPRATARLRRTMGGFVKTPTVTKLQLVRTEETPSAEAGHVGYRVDEMAVIVEQLLRDIGLTTTFSRIVYVLGHGSSSLNNPHEAAYDCGACSGGRGGPNARAFAQMANRADVRNLLSARGIVIPDDTIFIGAYHNTCDDSLTYYDLDVLPKGHRAYFDAACEMLNEARKRSAHERCRRFETASLAFTFDEALEHVEGRSEDLSQARPECGHATNALCFVGKRSWSKGLFCDRRAFLQSYDSEQDDEECTILARILSAVIPVCAGINLEYYFSYVDPTGYGCGSKLPHNITSLLGVMNGAESDLRPGLPWQMVEIHEPIRLLFVIETSPASMEQIMERNETISRLVRGRWVQLATYDPQTFEMHLFNNGQFELYRPESYELPQVRQSVDWYRGWRANLGFASISDIASQEIKRG